MDQSALGGVLGALQLNVPCYMKNYDQPRPELHTARTLTGYRWRLFDSIFGLWGQRLDRPGQSRN
jgi:hypothetical protein